MLIIMNTNLIMKETHDDRINIPKFQHTHTHTHPRPLSQFRSFYIKTSYFTLGKRIGLGKIELTLASIPLKASLFFLTTLYSQRTFYEVGLKSLAL